MSGAVDCAACIETYQQDGMDPPCDECGRPDRLPANEFAWQIWLVCHSHERPASMGGIMPITATSVLSLCKDLGGTEYDFEKVLFIDRKALPIIRENSKQAKDK